jgi:AcrR family transcriptional regulator
MEAENKSRRRPRGALTSEAIVDAAIGIVRAGGLDGLTMRSVARDLGVPVTSVHWHFRTRDDLLDVIAARMATDFYLSIPAVKPNGDGIEQLRTYFRALRQQLLQKRSFLELSFDRVGSLLKDAAIRAQMTERLEAEVSLLAGLGLAPDDAHRLYDICSTYVRGFVMVELAYARATRPITSDDRLFLDSEAFPVMSRVAEPNSLSGHDPDGQFDLGLDLLLQSIQLRAAPNS